MALRDELLKVIWHAFTALDVDKCGKVSKSQLKVLSHSLCTVLKVPHNPVALENHFKDDDEGPVSNQGYMPYLNKFILDKVEYFLRKLTEAMGVNWQQEQFGEYRAHLGAKQCGLSAWEFIELIGSGLFSKGMDRQTLSMAINEVYCELILDVMKQGYMWKKGHKRKNWNERWFLLKPDVISYYVGEDLNDKKGDILLSSKCYVESLPDKDGKKCLLLIKCWDKSFEISASDKKKKQEWIQAIQTAISLLKDQRLPPHKEGRQKRREVRQKLQAEQEEIAHRMKELQMANEDKQQELVKMRKELEDAAEQAAFEETKRLQTQVQLQDRFRQELEREKNIREQMEVKVAQKSSELQQYLQRVQELEEMYKRLEEALEDERQARQDEETVRKLQTRLLEDECSKREDLERLHLKQKQTIEMTEAEKQELENQRAMKERALEAAMKQLEELEQERKQALEQYGEVAKKLEMATNKTRNWKAKVAQHEGLLRLIQPGSKGPQLITNWGPASFTEAELTLREKSWQKQKNSAMQ
ncbi:switch-associated protein 70-like isoform X2 [Scyliorhinus canicula]|uniref:switch-associated protein 70-like isoform X2 n=1 Tax=Scyliorhinus canicula TaxID=7830 RepID=UPI0018F3843E|nr:switch-associated protein 70-like isoform X2 [Scyliorhinus canicula]